MKCFHITDKDSEVPTYVMPEMRKRILIRANAHLCILWCMNVFDIHAFVHNHIFFYSILSDQHKAQKYGVDRNFPSKSGKHRFL